MNIRNSKIDVSNRAAARRWVAVIVSMVIGVTGAWASLTQEMRIEGSASFLEGRFSGAGLNDRGELMMGYDASGSARIEEAAYVLSSASLRGQTYFGVGYPAALVSYDGRGVRTVTKFPGDFSVTSLTTDGRALFAAGLPSATIYQVTEKGETLALTDFTSAASAPNYIWAITSFQGSLYVGLGGHFPSVYRVNIRTGRKELLYRLDSRGRNVTALHVSELGVIFGDDVGRVFRMPISGTEPPKVLYAFSDAEIRAIVPFQNGLAVAVNSRRVVGPPPTPPGPMPKDASKDRGDAPDEDGGSDMDVGRSRMTDETIPPVTEQQMQEMAKSLSSAVDAAVSGTPAGNKPPAAPLRPESPGAQSPAPSPTFQDPFGKGEGNVFRMSLDGTDVHRLWSSSSSMVLALTADAGSVWAATSNPGRVYRITRDGAEKLMYETTSRDISILRALANGGLMAAASNPASCFELKPAATAEYLSKVFDVSFPANIGRIEVIGAGPDGIRILCRSGSTAEIDSGWTDFREMTGTDPQPVSRFFQAKLKFKSADALVRRVRIFHRIQNLYPRLSTLNADVGRSPEGPPDAVDVRLQWEATNLDNDQLLYQVYYQPPGSDKFIAMYEPSSRPRNVKTISIPADEFADGLYRFRLEVTDELSNGAKDALTHSADFPLVLLDRTPPSLEIRQSGEQVRWSATDAASRIFRVEYRINGDVWRTLLPDDGMLDGMTESGRIDVPDGFRNAVLDVRVFDERETARIQTIILK